MCLFEDSIIHDGEPPAGINPAGILFVIGLLSVFGFLINYLVRA